MFSIISTILISISLFPSFMNSPAISVGRLDSENMIVEICSGVAVSPSHAVTLFAFTEGRDVFIIENGSRNYPDSIANFRDMGLSMLIFEDEVFVSYEQPRNIAPMNGTALMILADHPTGFSVLRTFPLEQLSDGALLLASPPASEFMGAPVFDSSDRLAGIVTGSFDPGDNRGELMALLPCHLWYYWAETILEDAGIGTAVFGVTAMPATSGLSAVQGILILDVEASSRADSCGLAEGDIITEINGERVYHPEALKVMIQSSEDDLSLSVQRESGIVTIVIPNRN
jgi:hypothetical protein